jgi:predicted outer membrane protein
MRRVSVTSLALSLVLVGGCGGGGGGGAASVQSASASAATATIAPVMLSATAYLAMASSIDLYQVKSAQLALERAHDPANRAFAERSLSAHQGTSAQLSFAGRRLNLLPTATLDSEHQAMLDALSATSDFDNVYRAQQSIVLQEGVRLHAGYAKAGESPTLRPVAANAESVMRANLQVLRRSQ